MTMIARVTFFVEEVCANNLNWNTAILSMNRFVAIYFPYQFANLTHRNGAKNERINESSSKKYSAYLNYTRQFFGHLLTLRKTRKSGILLMVSIFIFSIFFSMPYLFYIDLKKGVRDMNSSSRQNTTVIVLYQQVSCQSRLSKFPRKYSYYYIMSKFFDSFSIRYDKFFSFLVYLLPSLLIVFSQIFVLVKLKKLGTINIRSRESYISTTNIESNLTMPNQNIRPNHILGLKARMGKFLYNRTTPKISSPPKQAIYHARFQLPKNAQNDKTAKSSKFYLDKYILTLAVGVEFLLLNLPYVIFVFVTNQSWVEGASSTIIKVQAIVYFLKYSNHAINVYVNIIFNSSIRTLIKFQLNRYYRSYVTRICLTSIPTRIDI
ncbi:unnamed protein product [Gordionus sp. m RMFG-2023]